MIHGIQIIIEFLTEIFYKFLLNIFTCIILLPTGTTAYANPEINIPLLSVILFYYTAFINPERSFYEKEVFCSRYFFNEETYRFPTLLRIEFFLVIYPISISLF